MPRQKLTSYSFFSIIWNTFQFRKKNKDSPIWPKKLPPQHIPALLLSDRHSSLASNIRQRDATHSVALTISVKSPESTFADNNRRTTIVVESQVQRCKILFYPLCSFPQRRHIGQCKCMVMGTDCLSAPRRSCLCVLGILLRRWRDIGQPQPLFRVICCGFMTLVMRTRRQSFICRPRN